MTRGRWTGGWAMLQNKDTFFCRGKNSYYKVSFFTTNIIIQKDRIFIMKHGLDVFPLVVRLRTGRREVHNCIICFIHIYNLQRSNASYTCWIPPFLRVLRGNQYQCWSRDRGHFSGWAWCWRHHRAPRPSWQWGSHRSRTLSASSEYNGIQGLENKRIICINKSKMFKFTFWKENLFILNEMLLKFVSDSVTDK